MNNNYKKSFVVLLVLLVCIVSITTSFAASVELLATKELDTLSKTQNDYLQDIKKENEIDVKAILTCENFIRMFRASCRNNEYSPLSLVANKSLKTNEIRYRLSEAEYYYTIRDALGLEIKEDALKLSIHDQEIGTTTAQISVLEEYSFTYEEVFTDDYYIKRLYIFNLEKIGSEWEITKVVTNNALENAEGFNYQPIDVTTTVAEIVENKIKAADESLTAQSRKEIVRGNKSENNTLSTNGRYNWTYYPNRAVQYAARYYNSTNSLFGRNINSEGKEVDCQNFASQCVWAGLGAKYNDGANRTDYPAVSTSAVGNNSPSVWSKGQYTNAYNQWYFNHSWDNASSFPKLIDESGSGSIGPFGTTVYGNLNFAEIGDVISVNYDGVAGEGKMDHAMVVTKLAKNAATVGYRSNADLCIAAHSKDTDSAYVPMIDYPAGNYAESRYATCMIICGYYPIAQPSL